MKEMLNIDSESLKKFQFKYFHVYLDKSSAERKRKMST